MSRLLDEARRFIRIASVGQKGNEEIANYVQGLMQDRGLKTTLQQVTHSYDDISKRQFNVIGVLGDPLVDQKIRTGLLLVSHLDTVPPGLEKNWTKTGGDPFEMAVEEDTIYGMGVADAKLDFLCKLLAVSKFREKKFKNPVYLVGTAGEELGMFGCKYLLQSMALNPKYVVVGKPTGLKLLHEHKSAGVFKINVKFNTIEKDAKGVNRKIELYSFGRVGHAAFPKQGENAIVKMFEFLDRTVDVGFELQFTELQGGAAVNQIPDRAKAEFFLTSHQFEDFKRFFRETVQKQKNPDAFRIELGGLGDKGISFLPEVFYPCISDLLKAVHGSVDHLSKDTNEAYDPPHATINLGRLEQSQGGVSVYFDVRLLPEQDPKNLTAKIKECIADVAKKYPSLNLHLQKTQNNPALTLSEESEFLTICKEVSREADIKPRLNRSSNSTEAGHFFAKDYESIAFGAGEPNENSHCPNEFNKVSDLQKSVAFYEKLIERICL